ncbi:MAG TPA: tetratricopeptide repeat protein, partial [Vicinamibacterales bacterium]|nr:tetratricopeptide repeat protein [Vicinamibacterales bacterium]
FPSLTVFVASLVLATSPASAQVETFVQSVRELAIANAQTGPARAAAIRAATSRMSSALAEWDRSIAGVEARAAAQPSAKLRVELALAYRTRGRTADAVRELDAAAAIEPSSSNVQVLRGLALEATGRTADAAKAFDAAWTLDTGNLLKAYYAGKTDALREHYHRFDIPAMKPATAPFVTLQAIPDNLLPSPAVADTTTARAFSLLAAENYSDVIGALMGTDATAPSGDSPVEHFARAQREEAENRVDEARREYESALTGTLVGRSAVLVAIARLAQVQGRLDDATQTFRKAVQLSPNDPVIRKELAGAYAARGEQDGAFRELMAALLIDPRDAQAHAAIGQLYLDAGRHADAVVAFRRALELAPARFEVRYALATALTRDGNTAEAAKEFEIYERQRRDALERRRQDIR